MMPKGIERPACALAAALVAITGAGCVARPPCTRERTCGAALWAPQGSPPRAEGAFVLAHAWQAAGNGTDLGDMEDLAVRREPVFLHFDLSAIAGRGPVERAVLALAPHPSWRPGRENVLLLARALSGRWTPQSVANTPPVLSGDPVAQALLPAGMRAPVRLDITALVRAWQSGAWPADGLALTAEGGEPVFAGVGAIPASLRPRIEVELQ